MPAIGAPLRKWTLFLLLCSSPTPAYTQATNETPISDSRATVSSSSTTQRTTSAALSSVSTARPYIDSETTCPFRTINYITHTLPQQCAKATWSAPGESATAERYVVVAEVTPSLQAAAPVPSETGERSQHEAQNSAEAAPSQTGATASADTARGSNTANTDAEAELETDSPLDNANFLSFEEWKKRNLAQVGQSPENVGQGRAASSDQAARRRPVNVNALDSLGDEAEIELDFTGFGTPSDGENAVGSGHAGMQDVGATKATDGEKKAAPSSWALSKDAGKTCKERFNYASFDCAATVLKTNKQAKSATSILVENKDSYMLNECSAGNKFLIVELCDDILVDTVVLGNYEFFSSMFRHFRVSVSDRYPVKMERWRTLATFEARNSRDIQPFLITEPQIWARYLRIEFLTQYGNEYYCPLSLLRVHGTTMMEQFRREEEEARGVDDDVDLEMEQDNVVKPAVDSGPIPADQVPIQAAEKDAQSSDMLTSHIAAVDPDQVARSSPSTAADNRRSTELSSSTSELAASSSEALHADRKSAEQPVSAPSSRDLDSSTNVSRVHTSQSSEASPTSNVETDTLAQSANLGANAVNTSTTVAPKNGSVTRSSVDDTVTKASNVSSAKAMDNTAAVSSSTQSHPRSTPTQPNPAAPSTQESFFKSIHKRLLYLEANSTLSLQYIEEQSRILRDAFMKVEKRQLAKTEKFLDHLNSTVMLELKSFRTMYDQLWQSTVIELESMKERQKSEVGEIGTRLSLMADELVWQKRMAVVQSTLLLLCLGLVLFVRSGTLGSAADVPIVQQLGSKYTSFFETSPPRSPPESGIARRRRILRNMWRSDTSAGLSDHQSDGAHVASDAELDGTQSPVQIEYSPPTPDTPGALAESDIRNGLSPSLNSPDTDQLAEGSSPSEDTPESDDQAKRLEALETQSGPATPNGTRDSRPSWEEVDRAIDQLKAEERGEPTPRATKRDRDRKKKRSPLRRAHSSFDGTMDDEPTTDSGSELFLN